MKKIVCLIIVLLPLFLGTTCQANRSEGPKVVETRSLTITLATSTPEPPTSTPESPINATQTIPAPESIELPTPCLREGFATYVNQTDSYCLAYPFDFKLSKDSGITISSGPLDDNLQPVIVSLGIQVQPAGDKTLDALVEAYIQETVGDNPPWEIPITGLSFRTEPGRLLDPVPGLGSSRVVIILHNNLEYRLIFYLSPVNPDGSLNPGPDNVAYDKFQALYLAVMDSFGFLEDPVDPAERKQIPLHCLENKKPFFIDPATGECSNNLPTPVPTEQPTQTATLQFTPTNTVVATPDPNQGLGSLRFEDSFDGSSGWGWGYQEEGVVTFKRDNGTVLAKFDVKNEGWRISLGPDAFTAGDQQVQLTARAEVCGQQDEWGLLFRGAYTTNDQFNGYIFKLNCAGQVKVDRLENNQSTTLLGWTSVPGVETGAGSENALMVWAGKDELRFYVNGIYVGSVTESTYPSGQYGIYVQDRTNGNAQFRFINLRVYAVTPD
jgi:hypothetical protein